MTLLNRVKIFYKLMRLSIDKRLEKWSFYTCHRIRYIFRDILKIDMSDTDVYSEKYFKLFPSDIIRVRTLKATGNDLKNARKKALRQFAFMVIKGEV